METEGYKTVELDTSVPGIGYTLKHRDTVELLIQYYCKKAIGKQDGNGEVFTGQDYQIMLNRGKCHDMDKVLNSLSYPQMTADYIHRLFNGHHDESLVTPEFKSKYDWMEMIFDMESAKYTKKDKQGGGAYSYACKAKQYIVGYLLPYFQLFGLDVENPGMSESIKEKVNRKYYEKDLVGAILKYMHTTRIHLLSGLSRIDDRGYVNLYGQSVPYRHPQTQYNGTIHNRPPKVTQYSQRLQELEMINGQIEAEVFDLDALCLLSATEVSNLNKWGLNIVSDMMEHKAQR